MNSINNTYKKPIKIGILFSIFTIILYEFGPYDFPRINRELLYFFLILCHLAMYLGYNSGTRYKTLIKNLRYINRKQILSTLFWIALLVSLPRFMIHTGYTTNVIDRTLFSIYQFFNGGAAELYASRQELTNVVGIWRYINYMVVLLGPLHWSYNILGIYYWKDLSTFKKISTIIIWAIYLLEYICTGTNVGIFEFFITFFVVNIIRKIRYNIKFNKSSSTNRYASIIIVALVVILIFIFDYIMGARIGDNIDYLIIGQNTAFLDHDNILWQNTPNSLKNVFAYLIRYLAIPYGALELSFNIPWSPTLGIGHSWFLLDNVDIFGSLWDSTYQMKLEHLYDYDHYSNWHTAYLWIANDVSFVGVPIVLFVIFRIFGKSWKSFILSGSICDLLIFMLFIKMMIFISANNQIFQSSDNMIAFWLLLICRNKLNTYNWEV